MPRLRRVLRAVLALSVTLVVWTLARPALAAPAPLCDDRGATALAPPPALEAPDVAIQRAHTPASCDLGDAVLGCAVGQGHRTPAPPPQGGEPVLPQGTVTVAPPTAEELDLPPVDVPPTEGVHLRVERPPRG